ncbi:DUF4132 domain-containing protein [Bacillus sp. FJAT-52991]|uniref:DUF4132 domain-containing protein n=1 Tax=Bacillus kandeliae TaxID=3129297 RepID=A0ABZ2NAL9_9BACI
MQTSEKIIDQLMESFQVFDLQPQVMDLLEEYLLGERSDAEIEKILEEIGEKTDVDIHNYSSPQNWAFEMLEDYVEEEIFARFFKISIMLIGERVLNLWSLQHLKKNREKTHEYFKRINIPFHYYILNAANKIMERNEMGDIKYLSHLEKLCDLDSDAMCKAFERGENAPEIFLGAVLWKKGVPIEGLEDWLKSCITYNLSIFLKDEMQFTDQELEQVNKNVQGEQFVPLQIHKKGKQTFLFNFLISLNYYMKDEWELSSRVLRLLIEIDQVSSFHGLFDYLRRTFNYRFVTPTEFFKDIEGLISDLQLPSEYYVAWLAHQQLNTGQDLFMKRLRLYRQQPDVLIKALQLPHHQGKGVLASLLCESGHLETYLPILEEEVQNFITYNWQQLEVDDDQVLSFVHYIAGEVEKPTVPKLERFYVSSELMRSILLLKGKSPLFEKYVYYVVLLSDSDRYIFRQFVRCHREMTKGTFQEIVQILLQLQVEATTILPAITDVVHSEYDQYGPIFCAYIEEHTKEVIEAVSACDVDGRELILTEAKKASWEDDQFNALLIQLMGDSSKRIRKLVMDSLENRPNVKELVLPLLGHKKIAVREQAVRLLINHTDQEVVQALQETLENERSQKVKELIIQAIQIEELGEEEKDLTSLAQYCEKHLNKRKKSKVDWITPSTLPTLMAKDQTEDLTEDVVYLLLTMFADTDEVTLNSSVSKVAEFIEEKSLQAVAYEVLLRWIADGAQAKRKWVLSMAAQFGDSRAVHELSDMIVHWTKNSRGAIASLAVKALALQGSDEALLITDGIAQKIKHKQVRRAASEALEVAAKEFGITTEELGDRLIPTLGFDREGRRIFDYGPRSFTVEITPEQTMQIFKEDGKSVKNLPPVAKSDDEQKASDAREQFKLLKKQLKSVVSNQKARLEAALSQNRTWAVEKWEKLFVENVIMQSFAIGLIWGVYEEGELIQSFRYMDDGTFNTIDEEEYELPEDASIGLIHPLDLEAEDIEQWKEQLEDYEIIQPISQLDRQTFVITETEKSQKDIVRFAGRQMNDLALLGRMDKSRWYKGSVQDAGGFYEFYKEIGSYGAELRMTGMYVAGGDGDVMIKEIVFYQAGMVERGSYIYDEVTDKNRIMPKHVPERIFSEILFDVSKATEKYDKLIEEWRDVRW